MQVCSKHALLDVLKLFSCAAAAARLRPLVTATNLRQRMRRAFAVLRRNMTTSRREIALEPEEANLIAALDSFATSHASAVELRIAGGWVRDKVRLATGMQPGVTRECSCWDCPPMTWMSPFPQCPATTLPPSSLPTSMHKALHLRRRRTWRALRPTRFSRSTSRRPLRPCSTATSTLSSSGRKSMSLGVEYRPRWYAAKFPGEPV
jgi:hypothetical protein